MATTKPSSGQNSGLLAAEYTTERELEFSNPSEYADIEIPVNEVAGLDYPLTFPIGPFKRALDTVNIGYEEKTFDVQKSLENIASPLESVVTEAVYYRYLEEDILPVVLEAISFELAQGILLDTDYFSSTEIVVLGIEKGLSEDVYAYEDITFLLAAGILVSDIVVATDDYLGQTNLDDDQVMLFEKSTIAISLDTIELYNINIGKLFENTLNQSEEIIDIRLNKGIQDYFYSQEDFSYLVDYTREINEQVQPSETLGFSLSIELVDSILAQEYFSTQDFAAKELIQGPDLYELQEAVTINMAFTKLAQETVLTNETRTANIQNYFLEDYVYPGYVGTNLTL